MNLKRNLGQRIAILAVLFGIAGYAMILDSLVHGPWTWETTFGVAFVAPLALAILVVVGMLLYMLLYFLATGKNWVNEN